MSHRFFEILFHDDSATYTACVESLYEILQKNESATVNTLFSDKPFSKYRDFVYKVEIENPDETMVTIYTGDKARVSDLMRDPDGKTFVTTLIVN